MIRELWKLSDAFIICSVLIIKSTTAQFPNFSIQANNSLSTVGDTVVIKCLLYNVSSIDIVHEITWFKDDIKLTQGDTRMTSDVTNDPRYSVNIVNLKIGMVSSMQITNIIKEDEGVFSCELTNRMNAKQRKSISISVEDPEDQTVASDIAAVVLDSSFGRDKSLLAYQTEAEENVIFAGMISTNISTDETTDDVSFSGDEGDSDFTTPAYSDFTTLANSHTTTPADSNITTTADNNFASPSTSKITTPANSNSTKPLLLSTESVEKTSMATGEEKEKDIGGVIAAAILTVLVILVVVITVLYVYYRRRRNMLNFKSGSRKDNSMPSESSHGYQDVLPVFSQNYKNLDPVMNQEPKFTLKSQRHPYEDANDRAFLREYEEGKNVRIAISDAKRNIDNADMKEELELSTVSHNSSDRNLSTNSDQDSLDGRNALKTKTVSPYERCHSMDFLQEFEKV